MRPRILIAAEAGERVADPALRTLDARQSHHLVRVLRLPSGATLECFDGRGGRFDARIERADAKACIVRVLAPVPAATESPLPITLAQCISAPERMDWTVEKAVELGVHAIQPLVSGRMQARLDAQRLQRRHEHWARIVEAACMQCGRDRLPALAPALPLERWVAAAGAQAGRTRIVLAPDGDARLAGLRIDAAHGIDLLVGPESGFDPAERLAARSAGFVPLRLGPRILRTETAGPAAIAALQALAGDF